MTKYFWRESTQLWHYMAIPVPDFTAYTTSTGTPVKEVKELEWFDPYHCPRTGSSWILTCISIQSKPKRTSRCQNNSTRASHTNATISCQERGKQAREILHASILSTCATTSPSRSFLDLFPALLFGVGFNLSSAAARARFSLTTSGR